MTSDKFYCGISVVRHLSLVVRHLSLVICRSSFVVRHLSFVVRHLSLVICRSSLVTCRSSLVTCHLSFVICHYFPIFALKTNHIMQTNQATSRSLAKAFGKGAFIGLIGAFVKWGWEVPFPPCDPNVGFPYEGMTGAVVHNGVLQRVTPPQVFLEQLGLPHDWTYTFSGVELPLSIFIVHILFSVVFAVVSNVLAHVVVMPLIGLVPPLSEIPFDENLSEMLGHIFWVFVMEMVLRGMEKSKR